MKAVTTLFALAAIVFMVILSANLFLKDEFILSYSLIIVWISSTILLVKYAASLFSGKALFNTDKA